MTAPDSTDAPEDPRPPRRWPRILRRVLLALAALLVLLVGGVLVWSQVGVMAAEPEPLAAVRADPDVRMSEVDGSIVLTPGSGESTGGIVFIPGAKVDPAAYARLLSGVVAESGTTVVIPRPWLNLAFFDLRPLSALTAPAPEVDHWIIGGHSLGGVRACMLADQADGLLLFGSFCATDLSMIDLPVLSIAGDQDLLSTGEEIAAARDLLPEDARLEVIAGANHASFGQYGVQAGDGTATISAEDMRAEVTVLLNELVASVGHTR